MDFSNIIGSLMQDTGVADILATHGVSNSVVHELMADAQGIVGGTLSKEHVMDQIAQIARAKGVPEAAIQATTQLIAKGHGVV
jgi:hypothetical protein